MPEGPDEPEAADTEARKRGVLLFALAFYGSILLGITCAVVVGVAKNSFGWALIGLGTFVAATSVLLLVGWTIAALRGLPEILRMWRNQ